MEERYLRNTEALSPKEVYELHAKKVCVVGCGGLGGYIIETLARIGVLNLTVVDFDVFDVSNLNRQLFSTESVIGRSKAEIAAERIHDVNSAVRVNTVNEKFSRENAEKILSGHDLAIDALDNIPARLLLFDECEKLKIPAVYGSIGGWYGQVSSIFPGDRALIDIISKAGEKGIEASNGNLPFTASAIAALQCAEAVKILTGRGSELRNAILHSDFLRNDFSIVNISQ